MCHTIRYNSLDNSCFSGVVKILLQIITSMSCPWRCASLFSFARAWPHFQAITWEGQWSEGGMKRGDEEEEEGGGGRVWVMGCCANKVGGQIIKSVRLLAASSNLKEFINAASQACGSANQLSSQCLAMLMPSPEWQERDGTSERKTREGWGGCTNPAEG